MKKLLVFGAVLILQVLNLQASSNQSGINSSKKDTIKTIACFTNHLVNNSGFNSSNIPIFKTTGNDPMPEIISKSVELLFNEFLKKENSDFDK